MPRGCFHPHAGLFRHAAALGARKAELTRPAHASDDAARHERHAVRVLLALPLRTHVLDEPCLTEPRERLAHDSTVDGNELWCVGDRVYGNVRHALAIATRAEHLPHVPCTMAELSAQLCFIDRGEARYAKLDTDGACCT